MKSNRQNGYIISIVTYFVLTVMLMVAASMAFLAAAGQKSATNSVKSAQSYYAAEAGIEDALLRLKKTPQISSLDYSFDINNTTVNVNIPSTVGISKSITSKADNLGIVRSVETVVSLDNTVNTAFYYGVEVGEGGLVMLNGSQIQGNVFSGGNISGGSGTIDNNVVVSGNGHSIDDVHVKGNVSAYSCLGDATVDGNLTYVTGGTHTCTVYGTTSVQSEEILEQPLPIPDSQIAGWKTEAASAQVISGNVTINNGATQYLGPVKITGSLTVSNGATLIMTGTVYVAGDIAISNNATVRLDNSYAALGGVLVSDGEVTISNNSVFSGSGQAGSYLLIISSSTSDQAISINNNAAGAVFYTTSGGISISNGVSVIEATGYKVIMSNNSKIQYSSGIVNIYFSSGPSAGWKVTSWQEQ